MGWKEIDDKFKRKHDKYYVSCDEEWEIKYIEDEVKSNFPELDIETIRRAIRHCCEAVPPPRPLGDFLDCLKRQLS